MNAGQMLVAVAVGAPPAVAVQAPSAEASMPAGKPETTAFAGVLRDASPREAARPKESAGPARNVRAEVPRSAGTGVTAVLQADAHPDAMATLLAVLEVKVQEESPDVQVCLAVQEAERAQMFPELHVPQNVVQGAVQSPIDAAQQSIGRMPEAEQRVAGDGSAHMSAGRVDVQPLSSAAAVPAAVSPQLAATPPVAENVREAVARVSVAVAGTPVTDAEKPVTAAETPVSAAETPVSAAGTPASAEQHAARQTDKVFGAVQDRTSFATSVQQPAVAPPAGPHKASRSVTGKEVQGAVPAHVSAATLPTTEAAAVAKAVVEIRPVPDSSAYTVMTPAASPGSAAVSATPQPGSENRVIRSASAAETAQNAASKTVPVIPAASAPAELPTVEGAPAAAEITAAGGTVRPNLDAYFQTSVRPVSAPVAVSTAPATQAATPPSSADTSTDVQPVTDAAHRAARMSTEPHNELVAALEKPVVRQDSVHGDVTAEAVSENAVTKSVTEAATAGSGEEFGRGANGFGDQGMSSNAHLAMSHQAKQNNALPAVGTSAVAADDPLRSELAEQVVSQVKDHLAGREIKTGVEQVVIRLSPENLGELKLNLRMENQCLKVEIVAETAAIRDTLMKHSETLKESLARQNITMETFDVSTDSNRQGSTSQGQGDWRELARQRQYNAWAPAGGYKLDDLPVLAPRPLYQAASAHSMVDVHF